MEKRVGIAAATEIFCGRCVAREMYLLFACIPVNIYIRRWKFQDNVAYLMILVVFPPGVLGAGLLTGTLNCEGMRRKSSRRHAVGGDRCALGTTCERRAGGLTSIIGNNLLVSE